MNIIFSFNDVSCVSSHNYNFFIYLYFVACLDEQYEKSHFLFQSHTYFYFFSTSAPIPENQNKTIIALKMIFKIFYCNMQMYYIHYTKTKIKINTNEY